MYVERIDEFMWRAQELFVANPDTYRYSMKYNHSEGKLVLKATDDRQCIKYKTEKVSDVKKVERFNNWLFNESVSKENPKMVDLFASSTHTTVATE